MRMCLFMNVHTLPCNSVPSFESYKIAVKGTWLCVYGMGMLVAKQQGMDIIMLPSNSGSVVTCTDFCGSSCLICRKMQMASVGRSLP